jgi:hypothetical protein
MWVTAPDKEEFLQGRPEPVPPHLASDRPDPDAEPAPQLPRPLDPLCHYGEESEARPAPRPHRDSGDRIDAAAWVTRSAGAAVFGAVRRVNGLDVPEDLIALRRAFAQADQHCRRIAEQLPAGRDIVTGAARISADMADRLAQASVMRRK